MDKIELSDYTFYEDFNRCGRVYSREAIEEAVKECDKRAREGRVFGELDHPTTPTINLSRVAIKVEDVKLLDEAVLVSTSVCTSDGFRNHGIVSAPGDIVMQLIPEVKMRINPRIQDLGDGKLKIVTWDVIMDEGEQKNG